MESFEVNLENMTVLCQILGCMAKDQVWELGKTSSSSPPPHLPQLSTCVLHTLIPSPPRTDTWLKGRVLQVSWCTSWLLMGRMIPWEAGLILNMKRCQNLLASSWRGDFFICIPAWDWGRAWVPGGPCSLTGSWVGCSSLSGFFQNLPNLNSIFSLCHRPPPEMLAPTRCGTATNRSGFSSASPWLPRGSSLGLLSSRSTGGTELWLWPPSWGHAAFPSGGSTSSWSKRRCMMLGPRASFRLTDGEAQRRGSLPRTVNKEIRSHT